MKITLATPIYPPHIGGPAEYARELPERLTRHEITVVAYTDVPKTDTLVPVATTLPLPLRLVTFFYHVWKVSKDADVIYAQNAVAAGLPALIAGILRKKRVVIKFVGDEAWERARGSGKTSAQLPEFLQKPDRSLATKIFIGVQKYVLNHADVVTTPSRYLGELITTAYNLDSKKVIPNYNAAASYAPQNIPLRKQHQIATAVRLVKWKGVDGIIDAVALLIARYPSVHLMIAGDGPERSALEARVASKNLQQHVTFLGTISREETEALYASSAAMVLNSTYEGLPFGALMSFATHTPVIATHISGTDEVVTNGETGLLITPNDPEALAHAIARLFDDEMLRISLAANAYARLQSEFSWKNHLTNLERILGGN